MANLNDRAQAQWPKRWVHIDDGYWIEESPYLAPNDLRMMVNTEGMNYLLNQVPKELKKEPKNAR